HLVPSSFPTRRSSDLGALRLAVAAEQPRAPTRPHSRQAFLDDRALQVVRLAPDGRHVAYLRNEGESRSLWLLPTEGGVVRRLLRSEEHTSELQSRENL